MGHSFLTTLTLCCFVREAISHEHTRGAEILSVDAAEYEKSLLPFCGSHSVIKQ